MFHGNIISDVQGGKKIPLTFLRVEKNGDLTEFANGWNQDGEVVSWLLGKLGEEDKGVKNVSFKDKRINYAPENFTTYKKIKSKTQEELEKLKDELGELEKK